ncbi:MalY/PatB family protein [Loigolactobacillus jiayinensis]|uniref:cysteine-S-conjugate beta-lyase n=1 Tax=Loigolactobacillus jiayinensis TaxID=2486016 RepID=A0ABW1RCJ0_9LACO|nr:aminotransferase class I/II-fold pyridoxal phosphate-dependent enzyme [Loigolactobacillus jiayinensis]
MTTIFDTEINRTNSNSEKWDLRESVFNNQNILPMWVADTDFMAPQEITNSLVTRLHQSPLGYTFVPNNFYSAISKWYQKRHQVTVLPENIQENATVMSSMNLLIRILTKKNAKILMFNPIYFPFFKTVKNLERQPLFYKLNFTEHGLTINFIELEKLIANERPHLLLLCNPHNPGGRVWTAKDLKQLTALTAKYHIPIISDEIHSDLIFPGEIFTPILQITGSNKYIYTLSAPTKTFNIAGLKSSFLISSNKESLIKFQQLHAEGNYPKLNTLAITATITAYTQCEYYVDELNDYLYANYLYLKNNLNSSFTISPSQGTYLVLIKFPNKYTDNSFYKVVTQGGIGIQMGRDFGTNGKGYFRINIGTTLSNIKKAVCILNALG